MTAQRIPPLPTCYQLSAASEWRSVEFISDLHLCAELPATFERWARYWRETSADAVFILGDLFEVWVGDDACTAGSFAERAGEVLAEATSRRSVGLMVGNRDFLIGHDWLRRCGLLALPDPTILDAWGQRVLLSHGDELCLDDTAYQAFRAQVRSPAWRSAFLAKPLAERVQVARSMRDASEAGKRTRGVAAYADVDGAAAVAWMHACGCSDLVHGHTHRPGSGTLAPGYLRHVLSDWDLDTPPLRAQVLRLTRDGFARVDLKP